MDNERLEEFFRRYEKPVIEELTIGFSGIDPPLKQGFGLDHEQLNNLLGGDANGHYHLTRTQLEKLREKFAEKYPPNITSGQEISGDADEEIAPYELQGVDVRS